MGNVAKVYAKGLHEQTKFYYAQWMPNSKIEIGTVGELEDDYFFRPISTLADLGINFAPERDIVPDESPTPIDLVSSRSVSMNFQFSTDVNPSVPNIPKGSAGIGFEFSSEGAFVIKAAETYEPRIRNVAALEPQILKARQDGLWKKNYAVIYSLVHAPYADIIISQSSSSGLSLQAQADVPAGPIELGNANVKFGTKKQIGTILNMVNSRDVTPIFQLVGIKRKWFSDRFGPLKSIRPASFEIKADQEGSDNDDLYIDVIKYGDSKI